MSHVWWLSRSAGVHDVRWTAALERGGHRVTSLLTVEDVPALRRRAELDPVDVVVAGPLTDAVPLAVEADVAPVIGLSWGFDLLEELSDPPTAARSWRALRRARWVHVDAGHLRTLLVEGGFPGDRVSVAPWGIDLQQFTPGDPDPGLRAFVGATEKDVVVLTNRAWEPRYAVDVVLDGVARAVRAGARLRLAWAGSGSLGDPLRARVRAEGIDHVVTEVGRLSADDLRAWLRSCDLYVSAARTDGSSLSLMEALACGVVPLVTDLPTNAEWVSSPEVGALFPDSDPGGLCAALLDATRALPRLRRQGSLRRALVEERGDWRLNQRVLIDAVERVVSGVAR